MHDLDPALIGVDVTPPEWESSPSVSLSPRDQNDGGCLGGSNSCQDLRSVFLKVAARDDRAPADAIGFRVRLVSGRPPPGFAPPQHDVRPLGTAGVPMPWSDGDSEDAFAFTLSVTPVDLAGNLGETRVVTVSDPGAGGCAVARTGIGALWPCVLLALFLCAPPRRGAFRSPGGGEPC